MHFFIRVSTQVLSINILELWKVGYRTRTCVEVKQSEKATRTWEGYGHVSGTCHMLLTSLNLRQIGGMGTHKESFLGIQKRFNWVYGRVSLGVLIFIAQFQKVYYYFYSTLLLVQSAFFLMPSRSSPLWGVLSFSDIFLCTHGVSITSRREA